MMRVLVDTSVWSLALRRRGGDLNAEQKRLVDELARLIGDDRVAMIGPIRQELLSGVREEVAFERLRERLRDFHDELLTTDDYEAAARAHNVCRAAGIAGSAIDLLICSAAQRRGMAVLTTDRDFERYARLLELELHQASA